jgi:hypothetical protein
MGTHYGVRPTGNIRPKRRFRTSLLTITNTVTSTGNLGNPETFFGNHAQPIVWEFTHIFPRNRGSGMCFFEAGGSFYGMWYGIRSDGTLRFRAGNGQHAINTGANNLDNCACLDITNYPQTGRRYLVTLQYKTGSGGYVEIYINNRRAGQATAPNGGVWPAYGSNNSFFFGGGTTGGIPVGEVTSMAPNAFLKSDLLHFQNQTVRANPT